MQSTSEVKNAWSYVSVPPVSLHGMQIYLPGYSIFHMYITL
jgi:hypothetical protein